MLDELIIELEKLKQEEKLNLKSLAQKCGVPHSLIHKIINKNGSITIATYEKIVTALGKNVIISSDKRIASVKELQEKVEQFEKSVKDYRNELKAIFKK
jgi:plasmid maintenance system antidote protein VapI